MAFTLAFSRLCLSNVMKTAQKSSQMQLHMTPALCGEPIKKKKRIDPQIIKGREDRKKRKIEKQIRRLEKNARQLKPIDENELPRELIKEEDKKLRTRPVIQLSEEEIERRALLHKAWSRYKNKETIELHALYERVMKSHRIALDELRKESESLYLAAIEPDVLLMPITIEGPVATPPIDNYMSPAEMEHTMTSVRNGEEWDFIRPGLCIFCPIEGKYIKNE